ncbi:MAG: DUF1566 domain-containing protein [Proteobacteria bacterium]|jgi:hypothetical protein|nr:DUF1566 domain-containing protein [Pseudomonadota bacterium]
MKTTALRALAAAAAAILATGCVVENQAAGGDDGGADGDSDADAGEDAGAYLACDENGDVCHFDADGDPVGVAVDCPDQNSVCVETDGGAPECQCVAHFELATGCSACETGWGGAACAVCEIGYGGAACAECVEPYVFADGECVYGAMCGADSLWLDDGALPGTARPDEELAVGGTPGEGTTVDLVTGLEWQRCPTGTVGDGTSCTGGDPERVTHAAAITHCAAPYGGHGDWRLPEASELQSLFDYKDGQFHINANYFWGLAEEIWSSTEMPGSGGQYFVVGYAGMSAGTSGDDLAYGLCVRDVAVPESTGPRFALGAADGSTAIDLWAAREWRRCAYGQVWYEASCLGVPEPCDPFADPPAEDPACGDEYGGHADWRVPNAAEMTSLLAWCDEARHYFAEAFAVPLGGDRYWTATAHPDMDYVYAFDLSARQPIALATPQGLPVLCVRDPG